MSSKKRVLVNRSHGADSAGSEDKRPKSSKRRIDDEKHHWDLERMPRKLKDDRYTIKNRIGKGTFGTVFIAHDAKYNEDVALKIIRGVDKYHQSGLVEVGVLKNVYREMKKVRHLVPRPCLKLYSYFEIKGHLVMVCELLGSSLYDVLRQNSHRGFPLSVCINVGAQIVRAVQFLHEKCNIIHTDLKLENIVFTHRANDVTYTCDYLNNDTGRSGVDTFVMPGQWEIKLIDLGGGTVASGKTRDRIINTRQYRCPEVILKLGWEKPSDMWSVGCILAEMYTGDLLFGTHDNIEHLALMEKVLCDTFHCSMLGHKEAIAIMDEDRGRERMVLRADRGGSLETFEDYSYTVCTSELSSSSLKYVEERPTLDGLFRRVRVVDQQRERPTKSYQELCRSILRIDPKHRATANEAATFCQEAFSASAMGNLEFFGRPPLAGLLPSHDGRQVDA
jgi:serine/threonine protein kinase